MDGILFPCLVCGEPSAQIEWKFGDAEFHCVECDNCFSLDHAETVARIWSEIAPAVRQMHAVASSAVNPKNDTEARSINVN